MKTNEAPEKIYMTPSFGKPDNVLLASFSKSHLNFHRDVEYIRADTFIDKACAWLKEQDEIIGVSFQEDFLERFQDYMKGG